MFSRLIAIQIHHSKAMHFLAGSLVILLAACAAPPIGPSPAAAPNLAPITLRVGYFPNITHSQAAIGVADGTFAKVLGPNVKLDTKLFSAGPSAMEALLAGQLDLTYVGPSPAVNAFVKSGGQALRIVAGATSGGAVLVVRKDAGINSAADFVGKKVASPQLGNTQDIALRTWLAGNGLKPKEQGGTVQVMPVANPDILILFQKKELDAAWVPEPWGARLVQQGNARIFLDERSLWPNGEFSTALVVVSTPFLKAHPDLVQAWLQAHVELTQRIVADPAAAKDKLNSEIARLTGAELPPSVLDEAWTRQTVTYDPLKSSVLTAAQSAFKLGFLGDTRPNLDPIFDLKLLNEVLQADNMPVIP